MIPTWKLSAVQVLGVACLGVLLGTWLKRKLPILDRLNIPVPIVGGMVFAVIALGLRGRMVNFDPDVVLRDLLMVAFMTTVGLGARLQLIREGGVQMIWILSGEPARGVMVTSGAPASSPACALIWKMWSLSCSLA